VPNRVNTLIPFDDTEYRERVGGRCASAALDPHRWAGGRARLSVDGRLTAGGVRGCGTCDMWARRMRAPPISWAFR
jgi:hypothetical protein